MGMIEKKLRLIGSLGERETLCLFDSGASVSCIRPDIARDLERPISLHKPFRISTADEKTFMEVQEQVFLEFYIDDFLLFSDFFLVPGLTEEAIIGALTLQQWRLKLDFDREEVIVDPRAVRLRI
jgi:hypothetical protein